MYWFDWGRNEAPLRHHARYLDQSPAETSRQVRTGTGEHHVALGDAVYLFIHFSPREPDMETAEKSIDSLWEVQRNYTVLISMSDVVCNTMTDFNLTDVTKWNLCTNKQIYRWKVFRAHRVDVFDTLSKKRSLLFITLYLFKDVTVIMKILRRDCSLSSWRF